MDALSEVLRLARFGATVTLDASAHAPWCVSVTASASLARAHVVLDGRATLALSGEPPMNLEAGDLVFLPHGDAHLLGSDLDGVAVALNSLGRNIAGEMMPIRIGGRGQPVRWIALGASCERHLAQPLLD